MEKKKAREAEEQMREMRKKVDEEQEQERKKIEEKEQVCAYNMLHAKDIKILYNKL